MLDLYATWQNLSKKLLKKGPAGENESIMPLYNDPPIIDPT